LGSGNTHENHQDRFNFHVPKAAALGIAENDVVRLVHEHREEKRRKTGKKKTI
jgi:hypothetical protein